MQDITLSRRGLLGLTAIVAGTVLAGAASAEEGCPGLLGLSASQVSMRKSLGFKAPSPDANKRCGLCTFFTAASSADCGKCALLSGGAVPATGVCDSWAKKG
ncbi:MAG TPA: high-potential iron-sulfur protein [Sphingobium sp.]|uniref:high-potential iron-sulfur protein n=1 Tax=Sphingobium sp. TaxID=1912891 RepID=UPI002ED69382